MLNSISNLITKIDPVSLLIGILLTFWFDLWIKRPKLTVNGGGCGRRLDGTSSRNYITIYNNTGWFGINLGETKLFGFLLIPRIRFGIPFSKNLAENCRANVFLTETNEHVGQLWWHVGNTESVVDAVNIASGESARLILFSKLEEVGNRYFVYFPADKESGQTKIPEDRFVQVGTKQFYVVINYSHGEALRYNLTVVEKYNGLLYLESENGGGSLF